MISCVLGLASDFPPMNATKEEFERKERNLYTLDGKYNDVGLFYQSQSNR